MSENQSRGINDLSKYDAMTTEELRQILRSDMEAPEGQESDTETLLYVMEVLADRKRNDGHTENTALESYESFKKNYLPEDEDNTVAPERTAKSRASCLRWLRSLSAVAAVLVIVLLGSITAEAFGVDIWGAVVKWTQETFHFGDGGQANNGPGTNGDLEYASLQEALRKNNIDEPVAPTWIPEGFKLTDIRIETTPFQDIYNAKYEKGDKELIITIRNYLLSAPQYIEQSEKLVETYEVSGIEYYLLSNKKYIQAVWINDSFECHISGDLTIGELKKMIDSIEKG